METTINEKEEKEKRAVFEIWKTITKNMSNTTNIC
jgi:hypothetical protein